MMLNNKTKPSTNKTYSECIVCTDELENELITRYRYHMVLYNEMVEWYKNNKHASFKEIKAEAKSRILNEGLGGYILTECFKNELWYLWRKRDFRDKYITSIHYLTLSLKAGYKNKNFNYTEDPVPSVRFKGLSGTLLLPKPLPEMHGDTAYFNVSYSHNRKLFKVTVCEADGGATLH